MAPGIPTYSNRKELQYFRLHSRQIQMFQSLLSKTNSSSKAQLTAWGGGGINVEKKGIKKGKGGRKEGTKEGR